MIEIVGDLFDQKVDAIAIMTNGAVRSDGDAVMGKGTAHQAAMRWVGIESRLGDLLKEFGNHVWKLTVADDDGNIFLPTRLSSNRKYIVPYHIFTFPTKDKWQRPSNLALIRKSAEELKAKAGTMTVALSRPGCGFGGLKWEEVKPHLTPILVGDQFRIVDNANG